MSLERIKTFILVFLVLISFVLTIRLWNFSPSTDPIQQPTASREISLGGKELLVKDFVEPSKIIIHKSEGKYQLTVKESEKTLYKEMQQWQIQRFGPISNTDEVQINTPSVELRFPIELPVQLLPQLFKVNENEILPEELSFDEVFFIPDTQTESSIKAVFASTKHNQSISAVINVQDTNAYESLITYINNEDALSDIVEFQVKNDKIVYVPKDTIVLEKQTFVPTEISDRPLINNLFQDPTAVKKTGWYTDGRRKLETTYSRANKKYMLYANPISGDDRLGLRYDAIIRTRDFINKHDGWTDPFMLFDIRDNNKTLQFQMLINGYPILDQIGEMVLEWQSDVLTIYNRPLIVLSTPFPLNYEDRETQLPGGQEILENFNADVYTYQLNQIEDIRIGYSVVNEENRDVLSLEPNWYVKVSGTWRLLKLENSPEQGGI